MSDSQSANSSATPSGTNPAPGQHISMPTGTGSFLFTDIEESTDLVQKYPEASQALLARHHVLLHQAM